MEIQRAASLSLVALFFIKNQFFSVKGLFFLKTMLTFASDKTKATLFFHQNVILI
jgi:hypothetical protein